MDVHRMTVKRLSGHGKSVNACDWSSFYKFVCSGGQDRSVVLWNPFSQRPLATLMGHGAPVIGVAVHDCSNQLISLSTDKCIKVWDIRNHSCLQTFTDKEQYHPHDTLTAMLFDQEEQRLICGNKKIKGWRLESIHHSSDAKHDGAITDVLFNASFGEVISADARGTICIWTLETALSLDHNERRLLTATDRGICHVTIAAHLLLIDFEMWNYSNGSLLKSFHLRSNLEISDVVCSKMHGRTKIVAAGWDHQLTVFEDDIMKQNIHPITTASGHKGDIVSLAMGHNVHLLASADILGTVLIWNMESWTVKKTLMTDTPSPVIGIGFLSGRWRHVCMSLSIDGWLRAWNAFDGCIVWQETHSNASTFALHSSSNAIAIGFTTGSIEVLEMGEAKDIVSYRRLSQWTTGHDRCLCITWIHQQDAFVIANEDSCLGLWQCNGHLLGSFGDTVQRSMEYSRIKAKGKLEKDTHPPLPPDSITDLHGNHHSASNLITSDEIDVTSSSDDEEIPASLWQRSWTHQYEGMDA